MRFHPVRTSRRAIARVASTIVLLGCGADGGTAPTPVTKPLEIVGGNAATDTIASRLIQALTVEVRANGVLRKGAIVRFETVPTRDSTRRFETPVFVANLSSNAFSIFAADSTDASGRARTLVQLGSIAGTARVAITVPELGLTDTAQFTVLPGAASRLVLTVRDTAVNVNASYSIGAAVADRYGNTRASDVVTYSTTAAFVSIDATGRVTANGAGRAKIAVAAGKASDTSSVSVLPVATLAGVLTDNLTGAKYIATMNLDGTNLKKRTAVSSAVLLPRWNASSTRIVYYEGNPNSDARVYSVDDQGVRTQLAGADQTIGPTYFPSVSLDGRSIYYSAGVLYTYQPNIWRANADGSAPVKLTSSTTTPYTQPSPSPDGKLVVFNAGGVISTVDVATGVVKSLGVSGDFPQYSPDGSRIAFVAGGALVVMNADGSSQRSLPGRGYDVYTGMSWSPDGIWIIVGTYFSPPELVRASNFEILPLPQLRNFSQVSMR